MDSFQNKVLFIFICIISLLNITPTYAWFGSPFVTHSELTDQSLSVVEYNYKPSYLAEQLNTTIDDPLVLELSSIRHKGLIAEEYNPLQNKTTTEISYEDVNFDMINIV